MPGGHLHRDYVLGILCDADRVGTPFSEVCAPQQKPYFYILGILIRKD